MFFDPDDATKPFQTELFGANAYGFAYYVENDGFRAAWDRKALTQKFIEANLPITSALAHQQFSCVDQRRRWGRQIAPKRWIYEIQGEPMSAGAGRIRQGGSLPERELLKRLLGRGFARGTTDIPYEFSRINAKNEWQYNVFRCFGSM